jgi:AcrR family transcriptional regulator
MILVSYYSLMMSTATRQTAEERREAVLAAASEAFARHGLHGTSTEDVARAAGISQPYLFRLFGTKKALFIATVERCMADTLELFRSAGRGLRGEEALKAMGQSYLDMVVSDRTRLLGQLQAYAASDDPDVRAAIRRGYGDLFAFVEAVADVPPERVTQWFATGMLLNVIAAMDLTTDPEPWAVRFLEGCPKAEV